MLIQQLAQGLPYLIMASMMFFTVILHLALRRNFRRGMTAIQQDLQNSQAEITQLQQRLAEAVAKIQDAEERAGVLVPPTSPGSGLNVSRRTQVIRMSRRGDGAETIATSLHLPKREVELVLKVHRLAVDGRLAARDPE